MTTLLTLVNLRAWRSGRLGRALRMLATTLMLIGCAPSPDVIVDLFEPHGTEHRSEGPVAFVTASHCEKGCAGSGCSPFDHHCTCCARAMPPIPPSPAAPEPALVLVDPAIHSRPFHDIAGTERAIPPPHRPPIG